MPRVRRYVPHAIVFVTSFSVMIVELIASRIVVITFAVVVARAYFGASADSRQTVYNEAGRNYVGAVASAAATADAVPGARRRRTQSEGPATH